MKKSISDLVNVINYYTQKYEEGHPEISDKEWDDLFFELVEREKEEGIVLENSPTQKITFSAVSQLKKVEHNHKMLSLDKTKDLNEINLFIGKDRPCLAMLKLDGLTCSLTYKDGVLVRAETRGNGIEGEDVLHNAQVISSIPKHINYNGTLVVDGEIIITYRSFQRFQDDYKNPRNFAAGSIRLLDSLECSNRDLIFVAWDVIEGLDEHISNRDPQTNKPYESKIFITNKVNELLFQKLVDLKKLGFTTVPFFRVVNGITESDVELLKEMAYKIDYPIDGLVFKFDNIKYGKSLGETSHHFKNALAFKFYDETYDTVLTGIEWGLGRTGVITPVALFETVDCDGSEVSKASLHNLSIMEETLGTPFVGQKIKIFKSNMIIPQVYSAEKPDSIDEAAIISAPIQCPECGALLEVKENEGVKTLMCINEECPGRTLTHLVHFCSKKGLDIKGLSEATLEKLMEWNWVKSPKDIFTLSEHKDSWYKKDGFGPKSVDKILEAIEQSKNCSLEQFISSLGIPLIGQSVAKALAKEFNTWDKFIEATEGRAYNLLRIPTFGANKAFALRSFNYTEAKEMAKLFTKINAVKAEMPAATDTLSGQAFCITGKLNTFKNRDELKTLIESLGGRVVDSVSKKTNFLVNNDVTSTSGKNKKAKELNIPIISEEELLTRLKK